ncbi:MAG: 3-hydroxyacyl-ACP dehydratase FabZ [Devosiaceae bacterium]|nr:3-hydroxyacyl-ACP dehydratase FabZ [Devosiaceae bacterium MH13]
MTSQPDTLTTLDIQKILKCLPHRYPFLLVDRIIEINGDESAIGIKNVTANEPQFTGHFPDHPIMPGVLIIEGIAQTCGALCVTALPPRERSPLVYFMTIDKTKFRKPVTPGDQLHYHVQKLRQRGNIWRYYAEAKVDGAKVAETEISAMILDQDA